MAWDPAGHPRLWGLIRVPSKGKFDQWLNKLAFIIHGNLIHAILFLPVLPQEYGHPFKMLNGHPRRLNIALLAAEPF
jgi:hypothetical protein